ncbi:MAG: protein-methionine-sulfoxide reductase catalytic subunit MsrP, partial [Rhodospirillales bacterium]|nr:protein-methionine-sulfoxide reductase catalytic subunit MsrP [Rhodospirillales bacterium]
MLIRTPPPNDIKSSEITPHGIYLDRRRFLQSAAVAGASLAIPGLLPGPASAGAKLPGLIKGPYSTDEEQTSYKDVTSYNNFYEFGTGKDDPIQNSKGFKPEAWKVAVEGEVAKPGNYDLDDLIKPHKLEERVYRFRCVEAWSMVIPWVGIPLGDIIKRFEPTSRAKYVAFETLVDPEQMPGQRLAFLKWPYREGLRMDEAMNPLTLLTVGLYGEVLPNQNGAPVRLVLPWKYGFKSIKSIV